MNPTALIGALTGATGLLVGFMAGYVRFNARVVVLETQFGQVQEILKELTGKVDALVMRFAPSYGGSHSGAVRSR